VRIAYRTRQFWQAVSAAPSPTDLDLAHQILSPTLFNLFLEMNRGEQAHSMNILHQLLLMEETQPDLLAAALLHDVGKSRYPLRLWERVEIVLGRAIFPVKSRIWGQGAPLGWRKPFVVAARHPDWGADMAAAAGASPLTVALIRRHQNRDTACSGFEDRLLACLQEVDDRN
jgi:hypothetical protein